jgi:predicted Zn-dependent peptidase
VEKKVTEFTLANGMHFILLERHQAPVISFHTFVGAGTAQDPGGQTGLTQLLERVAFKGTESIGTQNWPTEKKAWDDVEEAYDRLVSERNKGFRADQAQIASLEIDLRRAISTARTLADSGEFERVVRQNGGVGLSCRATADAFETSYSFPSNRMELWFLLESQRLTHPAFRDFYTERANMVTQEQNDLASKPLAQLQQALLATAFAAHPYRNPGLGWASDVGNLRRGDAKAFFDTYYVPGNIAMGIVGDVDPAIARRLADRYFGPIPEKPAPPPVHTEEPPQAGPKTVVVWGDAQPLLMIAYKRPSQTDPADMAFDVLRGILSEGQAGWLTKELVEGKRIAQSAEAVSTFPGGQYNNLFVFTVVPAAHHTLEENQKAVDDLLARLSAKPVDDETLTRVKNMLRGRIVRVLGNNQQLAALLPAYYADYGDWRRMFTAVNEVDRITVEDLQAVAARYFTPVNRTVAYYTDAAQPVSSPSGPRAPQ